jgi:hypothetical protein
MGKLCILDLPKYSAFEICNLQWILGTKWTKEKAS